MTWQNMDNAPRDGTDIEIECRYGAEPSYGIFHWEPKASCWGSPAWVQEVKIEMIPPATCGRAFVYFDDINVGPRSGGACNAHLRWRWPADR
jgi:hypothetical protein